MTTGSVFYAQHYLGKKQKRVGLRTSALQVANPRRNAWTPFRRAFNAHLYSIGAKMHLGTGKQYRGKELVGTLPCKRLKEFRSRVQKIQLPPLDCKQTAPRRVPVFSNNVRPAIGSQP